MQKYNLDSVSLEISNLEAVLGERVTNSLETGDLLDVAKGLIALDKESYKIDEEARRLRLSGELNQRQLSTVIDRDFYDGLMIVKVGVVS